MSNNNDDISRMSKKELEREVRRLRGDFANSDEKAAFALWIREVYHNRGLPGVIEESYKIYSQHAESQQEKQELVERLSSTTGQYFDVMKDAIRRNPNQTYISAIMLSYSPDTPGQIGTQMVRPQPYPGTRDEAIAEVLPPITFIMARLPTPEDVKQQNLDGISAGQLHWILQDLLSSTHDPDTFEQRRREKLEEIWAYLEREHPGIYARETVVDIFNKIVSRTKARLKRRTQSMSIPVERLAELIE